MQAALQGVLDAVLRARRGPWLHPESSPAVPAGRRAPLQRRLPETPGTVGTAARELEPRTQRTSIYPGSAPTAGWGRGHAGAEPARSGAGAGLAVQPASRATWWRGGVREAPACPTHPPSLARAGSASEKQPPALNLSASEGTSPGPGWPRPEGRQHGAPATPQEQDACSPAVQTGAGTLTLRRKPS